MKNSCIIKENYNDEIKKYNEILMYKINVYKRNDL